MAVATRQGREKPVKIEQSTHTLSFLCAGTLPHSLLFASLGRHALTPGGWILLLSSKQNRAVTLICLRAITLLVQDPRAVTLRALMSVAPNLCREETEPRSIHPPDTRIMS